MLRTAAAATSATRGPARAALGLRWLSTSDLSVTSLTRSVARITSPPAGPYSTQDCHAYLIGTGPDRILIDTGTGHTDFIDTLVLHLRAQNAKLSTVLLTHSHGNHASGLIRIFQRYNHTTFTVSKVKSPGSDKAGLDKIKFIKDGDIVSTLDGSVRLRTVHTPGHAADHACFWLDSDGILFSGDAILSRPPLPGTPLQPPSAHAIFESLPDYLASLTKLERLVPSLIFPAHGDIVVATLDSLQQARLAQLRLSQSIVDIIACHPARVVSTHDIIQSVTAALTAEYPSISPDTVFALSGTVRQHLLSLESARRIQRRQVAHNPFASAGGQDPSKIKGPGGLTMDKIFASVQTSRRRDWEVVDQPQDVKFKPRGPSHPLHAAVELGFDVAWTLV